MDELYQLSLALTTWLQESYPGLLGIMRIVSAMGEELFFLLVLPAVYWSLDKRLGRQLGYIFLLSVTVNNIAKNAFRQPRPFWLDPAVQRSEVEGYGLPSGHVQNATAILLLLAIWLRRRWLWLVALVAILLMALSRFYLGVHFLQDVIGGFILGLLVLGMFLLWRGLFAERFGKHILGRRLLMMVFIPAALAAAYGVILFLIGAPNLDVPWAARIPAAELNAHEDAVTGLAGLLGFGLGMILESSRIRFRVDGPAWQRVVRYGVGIVVAVGIWAGLRAVFPSQPEWLALPLRFLRYLLLLLWVTYFAPWVFVKLRLATADPESEVRVTL
ncbi:phosphatase PAP2 family protein [Promineifilum sp.]|uniref:phosphatase PAP2 family protein n=1 Tax=Promineifilum sp. TaxID=2664178 RepID=UPI0035B1E984